MSSGCYPKSRPNNVAQLLTVRDTNLILADRAMGRGPGNDSYSESRGTAWVGTAGVIATRRPEGVGP